MSFSFGFTFGLEAEPAPDAMECQEVGQASDQGGAPAHPLRCLAYVRPADLGERREVAVGVGPSMWVTADAGTAMSVPAGVDLLPGVYEGGLKLWESSVDLVRYMREAGVPIGPGTRVMELGCGHGLPGIHALLQGAHVTFSDLNEEVLQGVTSVNIALNQPEGQEAGGSRVRLLSGDWANLSAFLDSEGSSLFDLILTAETTYTEQSTASVMRLLARHLRPGTGLALIAGKRYYFGTGGSMEGVRAEAQARGLQAEAVGSVDDGRSNIRDILALRKKAA